MTMAFHWSIVRIFLEAFLVQRSRFVPLANFVNVEDDWIENSMEVEVV